MKLVFTIVLIGLLSGCATVGSLDRPNAYQTLEQANLSNQLLKGGNESNEALIQGLLNHRLLLPNLNRIAILKLNPNPRRRFYSSEFNSITNELVSELITTLRSNPRVYDASFLPSMLVPEKHNVLALREAAARFQADLLLIYNESCRSYQKYRLLKSDKNKSYCVVEALLLDTRSGVIAKSVVSLEEFESEKTENELSLIEATRKAELSAISKALGNVAREVNVFLTKVPVL